MDLPVFPDFKKLTLQDKSPISSFFQDYQPVTSEFTFTNLFLWRNHYHIYWSTLDHFLLIKGIFNDVPGILCPVGKGDRAETVIRVLSHLDDDSRGIAVERADPTFKEEVISDSRFTIVEQTEQFDYLYPAANFIEMSGRGFHRKRNHIAQLEKTAQPVYLTLGADLVEFTLTFLEKWCIMKNCGKDRNLCDEWHGIRDVLINFDKFNIRGGVVLVNGVVEAFTLGEKLNQDTVVIHVEKANPQIHGLYTFLAHQYMKQEFPFVQFVNREQDLGQEGLRKAKLSWFPEKQVKKYKVKLR